MMGLLDDMARAMMQKIPTEAPEKLDINEANILYALRDQSTSNRHLIEVVKQITRKYDDVRTGCAKLITQHKLDVKVIEKLEEDIKASVVKKIKTEIQLKRLLAALDKDGNKKASTVLKKFNDAESKRGEK
jgi:septal ring factor EnvC (AmiA/AmiB activator)